MNIIHNDPNSLPSARGETKIHKAAWHGRVDNFKSIYEMMLKTDAQTVLAKAMLDAQDKAGCTPLHNAVIRNHSVMVEELIKSGANINIQDNIDVAVELFWYGIYLVSTFDLDSGTICSMEKSGNFHKLIKRQIVWQLMWKLGMTPLMEAVFWDKVKIVNLILKENPETDQKDIQELARQRGSKHSYQALATKSIMDRTSDMQLFDNPLRLAIVEETCECVFEQCSSLEMCKDK